MKRVKNKLYLVSREVLAPNVERAMKTKGKFFQYN